jgi:ABC-type uncharacterized transport system ATPase subunit
MHFDLLTSFGIDAVQGSAYCFKGASYAAQVRIDLVHQLAQVVDSLDRRFGSVLQLLFLGLS